MKADLTVSGIGIVNIGLSRMVDTAGHNCSRPGLSSDSICEHLFTAVNIRRFIGSLVYLSG
jgi:hypothetical protein